MIQSGQIRKKKKNGSERTTLSLHVLSMIYPSSNILLITRAATSWIRLTFNRVGGLPVGIIFDFTLQRAQSLRSVLLLGLSFCQPRCLFIDSELSSSVVEQYVRSGKNFDTGMLIDAVHRRRDEKERPRTGLQLRGRRVGVACAEKEIRDKPSRRYQGRSYREQDTAAGGEHFCSPRIFARSNRQWTSPRCIFP